MCDLYIEVLLMVHVPSVPAGEKNGMLGFKRPLKINISFDGRDTSSTFSPVSKFSIVDAPRSALNSSNSILGDQIF